MIDSDRDHLKRGAVALTAAALAVAILVPSVAAASAKTKRASVSSSGSSADEQSWDVSISADGKHLAYTSSATNLIGSGVDSNNETDIYVHNRKTRKTRRVSLTHTGGQIEDGASSHPSISGDGRFVAFQADADDIVEGDNNGDRDIFVRDRKKGRTRRVSVTSAGVEKPGNSREPAISATGRFVVFTSNSDSLVEGDSNGWLDVFVHDRKNKTTRLVSVKRGGGASTTGDSFRPSISADGRFIAFGSTASDLVGADDNDAADIFVHDRKKKTTRRISRRSNGAEAKGESFLASISANGRYVAFASNATNLVKNDDNGRTDVFVHDRNTKKTRRVSVKSNGKQAKDESNFPAISPDGRFIAFESTAPNLINGDRNGEADVFVHDRVTRRTKRVSVKNKGGEAKNGGSFQPSISSGGKFVAFHSYADNLGANDQNSDRDIFWRGPLR